MRPLDIRPKLILRKPLKHDRLLRRRALRATGMTVCTASVFGWTYDAEKNDYGFAIIAASDRMLTDVGLGIEYEGARGKWAAFGGKQVVLVAGDMVVHAEIVRRLEAELPAVPLGDTFDTAERVARLLREYRAEEAARIYLAPLRLDNSSFLAAQKTMAASLVRNLAEQMLNYELQVEAIVLGCDGDRGASIYRIDERGIVTNHSNIGFVSIGNGGVHSSAHFMIESYTYATAYHRALYQTFKAKKRAEVAPGVGQFTDMILINRNGAVHVDRPIIDALQAIHAEDLERAKKPPEDAAPTVHLPFLRPLSRSAQPGLDIPMPREATDSKRYKRRKAGLAPGVLYEELISDCPMAYGIGGCLCRKSGFVDQKCRVLTGITMV